MLLRYCIRLEIYTSIQRNSARQMSILFVIVCFFLCWHQYFAHKLLFCTQYPLGNGSQAPTTYSTQPYVNCGTCAKTYFASIHTERESERHLMWWISIYFSAQLRERERACKAIGAEYVHQFQHSIQST